jgi:hypothetical protein
MRTLAKPIEAICLFDSKGITPIKFRYYESDESYKIIKVDKIISRSEEVLCGNNALVYDCQSVIDGVERLFQLKFFKSECKWILFKI